MDNYDYLKFTFRYNTDATSAVQEVIYTVSNFKTTGANGTPCGVADFTSLDGAWNNTRPFYYVSDTQVWFGYDYPWNGSRSAGASSNTVIPLKIEGLKRSSAVKQVNELAFQTSLFARANNSVSYTLDANSEYVVFGYLLCSETSNNSHYAVWTIKDNTLNLLNSSSSYCNCSISNGVLYMQGTHGSLMSNFIICKA